MSAPWRPGSAGRAFAAQDLDGADEGPFDPREVAEALGAARDLEAAATDSHPLAVSASPELVDRIMAAVASEPLPAPAQSARRAVRSGRLGAAIAAVLDAWHVARSGGRPIALRVQALSLVLVVLVAIGSLGGLVAVGTYNLLGPRPAESPIPVASPEPTPTPSPTPSPTSSASPSPTPSPSASPSESPSESVAPTSTPQGDSGGGSGARPTPTRTPRPTARPTDTPEPTSTEDHGGGGGETPQPTDDSGGGSGGGGGSGDGGSGSGSGGSTSTPGG